MRGAHVKGVRRVVCGDSCCESRTLVGKTAGWFLLAWDTDAMKLDVWFCSVACAHGFVEEMFNQGPGRLAAGEVA